MATPPPNVKELKNATTRVHLPRNASAPTHPSPLHESSPFEELKGLSIEQGSDTSSEKSTKYTAAGTDISSSNIALTPPDTVARDTQNSAQTSTQAASNAMGNFSYTPTEDPFVTPDSKDGQAIPATVSKAITQVPTNSGLTFSPREDRIGKEVNADNAQGVLTPKACVFVANLSNQRSDDQLEQSVLEVFGAHGKCYVKIRRDKNKMPFAFVQYETVQDANSAINNSRGAIIDGRPTRCEHAKVNRALYLTRHTGGPISDDEAHCLLEEYGAIESTSPISIIDQHLFNLPEGIMVQFAYFQDARDAQLALKKHEVYRVAIPQSALDFRNPTSGISSPSPQRFRQAYPAYTRRWSNEDSAIFIGNLPEYATEDQLYAAFAPYGQIQSINIVAKQTPNGDGTNTFAFMSFQNPDQADAALRSDMTIEGRQLRVERKEYSSHRFRRNTYNPRNDQEQILSTLYQQGVSMGLAPDQAAKIFHIGQRASIERAVQAWPTTSPVQSSVYYSQYNPGMSPVRPATSHAHGSPYAIHAYQTPLGYNLNHMAYYNQYPNALDMDDKTGMHTIAEADEASMQRLI